MWFQNRRAKWRKKEKHLEPSSISANEQSFVPNDIQSFHSQQLQPSSPELYSALSNCLGTENYNLLTTSSEVNGDQLANNGYQISGGAQGLPPGYYFVPYVNPQTVASQNTLYYGANGSNGLLTSYNYNLEQLQQLSAAGYPLYVVQDPSTGLNHVFYHFSACNYQYSSDESVSSLSENNHCDNNSNDSDSDASGTFDLIDQNSNASLNSSEAENSEASPIDSSQSSFEYKTESDEEPPETQNGIIDIFNKNNPEKDERKAACLTPFCLTGNYSKANISDSLVNETNEIKVKEEERLLSIDEEACSFANSFLLESKNFDIPSTFSKPCLHESENGLSKTHYEALDDLEDDTKDSLEDYVDSLVSMDEKRCNKNVQLSSPPPVTSRGSTDKCTDKNELTNLTKPIQKSRVGFMNCRNDVDKYIPSSECHDHRKESSVAKSRENDALIGTLINYDDKKQLEARLRRSQKELEKLNFDDELQASQKTKTTAQIETPSAFEINNTQAKRDLESSTCDNSHNADNKTHKESPRKRQRLSSLTLESYTSSDNNEAYLEKPIFQDCLNFSDCIGYLTNIKQERDDIEDDAVFHESLDLHSIREAYSKVSNYALT